MKKYILLLVVWLLLAAKPDEIQAQLWQGFSMDFNHGANCLYANPRDQLLYIGGMYTTINNIPAGGLVAFDGNVWTPVSLPPNIRPVSAICDFQGRLAVAGGTKLAILNGNSVDTVVQIGAIQDIQEYGSGLLMYGQVERIGQDSFAGLTHWDGFAFSDVHDFRGLFQGTHAPGIRATIEYRGELYVGGNIHHNGMNNIVRWNGTTWDNVMGGINGGMLSWINDMEVYNDELYVVGYFYEQNGAPGNNIAKWDGSQWSRIGNGLPGYGWELFLHDGKLYVVGPFEVIDGLFVDNVAVYDGVQWCALDTAGLGTLQTVAAYKGELYFTGLYFAQGGDTILDFAKWIGGNHRDGCLVIPVGTEEEVAASKISLVPNPAQGSFRVVMPSGTGAYGIRLMDMAGREVLSQRSYRAGDPPVDVSHLPAGVYVVQVRTRVGVENIRLVVN